MKIVVLNGSPRLNGNTAKHVEAFKAGAEAAGNEVVVLTVGKMNINGCLGCEYCHGKCEGKCIQMDDMDLVYPEIATADLVVLASPVYYWSFTGQMQSVITRFYAPGKPAAKKYAMIISSGSPNVYNAIKEQYKSMLNYFGAEDVGTFFYNGATNSSEAALAELKAFGESLK